MTKRQSQALATLIEQATVLEDLARQVQGEDEAVASDAFATLTRAYGDWYAQALNLLPDDLAKEFRFEYEGGTFQPRIKHFLQEPRKLSIFQDAAAQGIMEKWQYPFGDRFRSPLLAQVQVLRNATARQAGRQGLIASLDLLDSMFRKLPLAVAVLGQEFRGRAGIEVADEYDLQRIVHGILCLHFDDVRPEDYVAMRAGARGRIDFLLKDERVALETKMTRIGLGPKELGKELAEDKVRYQGHEHAEAYFALVYDPTRRIVNSSGFEKDFPTEASFPVRVVIVH